MSDSAEKDLPATHRKLQKARERGEVASSPDFVAAFTFTAVALTLISQIPQMIALVRTLLERSILVAEGKAPFDPVQMLQGMSYDMVVLLAAPVLVIIACAVLSNLLVKQGLPVSLEPLMPKLSRISPGSGIKNIFSGRGAMMMAIAIIKFTVWSLCAYLIIYAALPDILASGACGEGCQLQVSSSLLWSMFIFALAIIITAGLADVPIQIMLFLKQQKMSKEEVKKEYEDSEGKAEVKGHRRQLAQEMAQSTPIPKEGLRAGTVVVTDGDRAVVLMFRQNVDEIPVVIARGDGPKGAAIIAEANSIGLMVERDPDLARKLYKKLRPGDPISQDVFQPIAMLLVRVPPRR